MKLAVPARLCPSGFITAINVPSTLASTPGMAPRRANTAFASSLAAGVNEKSTIFLRADTEMMASVTSWMVLLTADGAMPICSSRTTLLWKLLVLKNHRAHSTFLSVERPLARWHLMMGSSSSHELRTVRFDRRKYCRKSSSVNSSNASSTSGRRLCATAAAAQATRKDTAEKENAIFSNCWESRFGLNRIRKRLTVPSAYVLIQSKPSGSRSNPFYRNGRTRQPFRCVRPFVDDTE
ncbi:hypothetical protein HPB49_002838 [Dermacentor silvarum]|uniref:Uncharacterized protein n=1 Tax=Dermacentor silvarum TaxID=543639 RepID=A0ACB8CNZ7_DERSI|nr:hypothetical protein HPB49_002838 [Dermacentor silvarum]